VSLVLVIRGGLWLGECLGGTAGQADGSPETSPRTIGSDRYRRSKTVARTLASSPTERYVVCIVTFAGSQSSPFFHSRSAIEAIFRASVTFASSGLVPPATHRA
jgi:hypothetical protein